MKIVTWNLRCLWSGDGINAFLHRAGMIYEKIDKEKPELIAFQEVVAESLAFLRKIFPEYIFFGQMRSENYDGEGLCIAIRKDAFDFLGGETFWLSPTPYIAGTRFKKQSNCPRICVYTLVRHKTTGQCFRIYNIHLDHESDEARQFGLQCVIKYMEQQAEKQEACDVLLGDFNAEPESGVMQMQNERKEWIEVTTSITETFHGFGKVHNCKIDYIFLSRAFKQKIVSECTWTDCHEGIYLSDHYPVCIELEL